MSTAFHRHARRRVRQTGMTLIELMVGIVIGLILLVGLISLIVSTVRTRSELDNTARQVESGRYALEQIGNDIQHAGFIDGASRNAFNAVAPVPCPASTADLGYAPAVSPAISSVPLALSALALAPDCIDHVKANAAMLLVTRTATSFVKVGTAAAAETYLQVSSCATDTTPFVIAGGSAAGSFTLTQKACLPAAPAQLRKVVQRLYFVSTCNVCSGSDADTMPTLKVAELVNGALVVNAVAEGIEDLRLDFGVDIDNNGSPDCYVADPANQVAVDAVRDLRCPQTATPYPWTDAVANWNNVMAVRIHVLARNGNASGGWEDTRSYDMGLAGQVGPFNDHYKRHAYSTVARLFNGAGQREQP